MEQGDVWLEQQAKRFHSNRCEVRLQTDENFVVKRMSVHSPRYQQLRAAWSSGTCRAQLQEHGSLFVNHAAEKLRMEMKQSYKVAISANRKLPSITHWSVLTSSSLLKSVSSIRTYRDNILVWTNDHFNGIAGVSRREKCFIIETLSMRQRFRLHLGVHGADSSA